jgi:hypothetical protein
MIQTLRLSDFTNAFRNSDRADQFSYHALELIFDYIEEYEQSTGEQVEFDMIGICCEWSENTPAEIVDMYKIDIDPDEESDIAQAVLDYLNDETQVAGVTDSGSIVYVQF